MALEPVRRHEHDEPRPHVVGSSFGAWGWLAVFVLFLVAVLLENFI